jgi:hypothetical protein
MGPAGGFLGNTFFDVVVVIQTKADDFGGVDRIAFV